MKYARQVEPQYQEAPYERGMTMPEDLVVIANDYYDGQDTEDHSALRYGFYDFARAAANVGTEYGWYKSFTECLNDHYPKGDSRKYSTREVHKWRGIVRAYSDNDERWTDDLMCNALELYTGRAYAVTTIRDMFKGAKQTVYYPTATYSRADIHEFGIRYYDEGTEWTVHDEEVEPMCADDVRGYNLYCVAGSLEGIYEELARSIGVLPADMGFYVYEEGQYTLRRLTA